MARKKKDPNLNPLTGEPANSFTRATNRDLPAPTAVRPFAAKTMPDPSGAVTPSGNPRLVPDPVASGKERRRLRAAHVEATQPGGTADSALGYRMPETMSHPQFSWVMGAHHMFPNTAAEKGVPAINEPHEANPGVTVQRRAEDLSGPEHRKGEDILAHYGHDPRDPTGSLRRGLEQQTRRVIVDHVRAGVEESASQLFYGGGVNTEIPDPELDEVHYHGVTRARNVYNAHVEAIARHPAMNQHMPGASFGDKKKAAGVMFAQAAADTSPNAKWRENDAWPNMEQASESVHAALEGRSPRFITGRTPNEYKAANRVDDMTHSGDYSAHGFGDPKSAPKTIAFRGANIDKDAADAFGVSDIHQGGAMLPGIPRAKSQMYTDSSGKRVTVHADAPASERRGLSPVMEEKGGKLKPVKGNSRVEEMLTRGAPVIHALDDRALREVATSTGISRGVNYADNTHSLQGALWGAEQVQRPDVNVSHADQYPVVRDWGAEGHANLNAAGRAFFGGSPAHLGPQFVRNPNTARNHVPGREPYDV